MIALYAALALLGAVIGGAAVAVRDPLWLLAVPLASSALCFLGAAVLALRARTRRMPSADPALALRSRRSR